MLAFIGFLMVAIIVYCLIQSKTTPVPIFALIPVAAVLLVNVAALAGLMPGQELFAADQIADFVKKGVTTTWPVAVLFVFSICFFGVLSDAGMFEPLVNFLVAKARTNVVFVTLATGVIATIAHLDGSLAVTLLITVPAMLPIYKRLNMRPITILIIIGAAMSIMNLLPWGGPVARIAAITKTDINALWHQLIPLQIAGVAVVLLFSAFLGVLEKRRGAGLASGAGEVDLPVETTAAKVSNPMGSRQIFNIAITVLALVSAVTVAFTSAPSIPLGSLTLALSAPNIVMLAALLALIVNYVAYLASPKAEFVATGDKEVDAKKKLLRPELLAVNICITILTLSLLAFFPKFPAYYSFMAGLAVALLINYPEPKAQTGRIKAHAGDALQMAAILLASGVFLGVLTGTKMIDAMATAMIDVIPASIGPYMHLVLGVFSIPIGMVLGTDSFFFGLVPLAMKVGQQFGIDPMNMAKALLIGKNYGVIVTPHAATTFLAIGLAGVELKEHLKVVTAWMWPLGVLSLILGLLLGIVQI